MLKATHSLDSGSANHEDNIYTPAIQDLRLPDARGHRALPHDARLEPRGPPDAAVRCLCYGMPSEAVS